MVTAILLSASAGVGTSQRADILRRVHMRARTDTHTKPRGSPASSRMDVERGKKGRVVFLDSKSSWARNKENGSEEKFVACHPLETSNAQTKRMGGK